MSVVPPVARYQQVANMLREAIYRGDYQPGQALPTEQELKERYRLSRTTVRQALGVLRAEGLIMSIGGSGSYVRDRSPIVLALSRYQQVLTPSASGGPFRAACEAAGLRSSVRMLGVTRENANPELAAWLKIPEGTEVIHRSRHVLANDQVAQIQDAWLPADLVEGTPFTSEEAVPGGTYDALIAAGHLPATMDEHIATRMPTYEEGVTLQTGVGTPVLIITRTTYDADQRVLEGQRVVAAGDRIELLYDGLPLSVPT
jgi:GntR family transcriptional regulator